jgi:PilZ domain-containing protein
MQFQNRKEYRKKLFSAGQLYVGGELLEIKSINVSVNGIMAEVSKGRFLNSVTDFNALIRECGLVEIYVDALSLAGQAEIIWAKDNAGQTLLGIEYRDVSHNQQKLWVKRQAYRRQRPFDCSVRMADVTLAAKGLNISVDGLSIQGEFKGGKLQPGSIVQLEMPDHAVAKAVARVIWREESDKELITLGLRYLELN